MIEDDQQHSPEEKKDLKRAMNHAYTRLIAIHPNTEALFRKKDFNSNSADTNFPPEKLGLSVELEKGIDGPVFAIQFVIYDRLAEVIKTRYGEEHRVTTCSHILDIGLSDKVIKAMKTVHLKTLADLIFAPMATQIIDYQEKLGCEFGTILALQAEKERAYDALIVSSQED